MPQPPAGAAPRLNFQQNAQQPAALQRNIPIRNLAAPPPAKKSVLVKILIYLGVAAALGGGGYAAWIYIVEPMQQKSNEKARQMAQDSDGGQVGHIQNLYEVLDATDPSNPRLDKLGHKPAPSGPRQRDSGVPMPVPINADGAPDPDEGPARAAASDKALPVVAPVWNLEIQKAVIPEGRVNGSIAGSNFVAEATRLDRQGTAYVLSFRQGAGAALDRALYVYLHLAAGESLTGRTWTVSQDIKPTGVTQVTKQFKNNSKYAPQLKSYPSGFALKLQLGEMGDGFIPGKIFVSLPDTEQSVVAGVFKATTSLTPTGGGTIAPSPGVAVPGGSPAQRAAFDQRYGAPGRN